MRTFGPAARRRCRCCRACLGAQAGGLCRRHGGRSAAAARIRRAVPPDSGGNGTDGAFYGHASVGCLHIRPLLDLAQPRRMARLERISQEVCELVLEFGGSMSGEHGDGLARSYLNETAVRPAAVPGVSRRSKRRSIRADMMNPGKIVDGPSPIENLRLGAELSNAADGDDVRFQPRRIAGQGGRAVQRGRRLSQAANRHDVSFVHGHAATKSTARAAGPTRCGWRCRAHCRPRN